MIVLYEPRNRSILTVHRQKTHLHLPRGKFCHQEEESTKEVEDSSFYAAVL